MGELLRSGVEKLKSMFAGDSDLDEFLLMPEHDNNVEEALPLGTKVFVSAYRYPGRIIFMLLFLFFCETLLFTMAGVLDSSGSTVCVSLAVVFGFVVGGSTLLAIEKNKKQYNLAVQQGTWMEGVIVFPTTGDIVVKLDYITNKIEVTLAKEALADVRLCQAFSWSSFPRLKTQMYHFEGLVDGENVRLEFPTSILVCSPYDLLATIEQYASPRRR